jgi:hypothetical protein
VREEDEQIKRADDIPVSELQMMRLELAEIKKTFTRTTELLGRRITLLRKLK